MKHLVSYELWKEIRIVEFKATCLAVLARVGETGRPVLITRFGKPVAQISPPPGGTLDWLGSMRERVPLRAILSNPLAWRTIGRRLTLAWNKSRNALMRRGNGLLLEGRHSAFPGAARRLSFANAASAPDGAREGRMPSLQRPSQCQGPRPCSLRVGDPASSACKLPSNRFREALRLRRCGNSRAVRQPSACSCGHMCFNSDSTVVPVSVPLFARSRLRLVRLARCGRR